MSAAHNTHKRQTLVPPACARNAMMPEGFKEWTMSNISHLPFEDNHNSFKLLETKLIPVTEWLRIADCPYQRNTAERAKKAAHLREFDDSHKRVAVAVLPGGERYKLDGHTRAFMWAAGETKHLPASLYVTVDFFHCNNRGPQSLGALYDRFDNQRAVQTASDVIYGASHAIGAEYKSALLKRAMYGNAIKRLHVFAKGGMYAASAEATNEVVRYFAPELKLLDEASPVIKDYTTPIIMASILTFMRYGAKASTFWDKYSKNDGQKIEGRTDGVGAMRNLLVHIRDKKMAFSIFDIENLGKAVNAFEMFKNNDWYTGKNGLPNRKDEKQLKEYIAAAVKAKESRR